MGLAASFYFFALAHVCDYMIKSFRLVIHDEKIYSDHKGQFYKIKHCRLKHGLTNLVRLLVKANLSGTFTPDKA